MNKEDNIETEKKRYTTFSVVKSGGNGYNKKFNLESPFNLTDLIVNTPNDGDLGRIIRRKFLQESEQWRKI
jgi:hypothetical protein